jgi:hypothetical protein
MTLWSILENAPVLQVRRFVKILKVAYAANIKRDLKERKKMLLNNFDQSDEELQKETTDSLIRIIIYWKGKARTAETNVQDLMEENDKFQYRISYLENEYLDDNYWDEI